MTLKKIAIYGGTFNPVHKAHLEIAQKAIEFLNLDKLFFVPNYINPLKKQKKNIIDPKFRYEMLKLVQIEKTDVCDFEIKAKKVSYTIDTINFFEKKYPNTKIFLIIGSDNLRNFKLWKNYKEILEKVQLVVFTRKNYPDLRQLKRYNGLILPTKLPNFSSSQIRKGEFSGLDSKVRAYIGKNFLYAEEILTSFLGYSKRLIHSKNTAKLANEYAKINNLDSKLAYYAGLFHDLTKKWTKDQHLEFLRSQKISVTNLQEYQLHQLSASIWLKNVYCLPFEEIIYAISCHTSLCFEMSLFDKIVYVADKLARGRRFLGVQKLRKLARQDLEKAFQKLVEIAYNNHKDLPNSREQNKIYARHQN
ncbi:nicotinate-nucleotide adenylyltransferase [Mycoplasma hyopneumoniae]|uniref:nicotinate-nucleotide adenylyltransferase n=2 Tax=Mesomycoplasma hyopneumoniae TaxID=2099 RepID=UPI0013705749|nr:nicotinate-nucleotide adenylyltransferase [Mesomycoplasma hyopneumoniae]MXR11146.1 nicotinate-nucleotide adenylyltransferase [Mesomycoplasma hyopneumoniae]MXR12929.1 nicotinate-nucleotide adenylyltransferase [Mesomycoplasma hyopneumoniae]MXR33824.1 nicotinate-nucleotide adenylyltransferase [Mesomycoplasma hyopneumoniae]MXR44678.1 nicotinate-nucleotide adenylyltransferase [Mesomycoplasma hyopneumoniae]MXR57519.1 nicotinate-nucleotide adenylyltransferase [Mesomycoplasma hyopneumoniae]